MNLSDIDTLYAYNRWANLRMFSVLEKLTEEQFTAAMPSSFASIRESVFHILGAEWIWLKRWQGISPRAGGPVSSLSTATWSGLQAGGTPPPQKLSTPAEMKSFCDLVEQERQAFLATLTEATLHGPLSYSDMSGNPHSEPLVDLMQHVVNHGTYHRGQVTTLLRQAGGETIALDMVFFFRDRQASSAAAEAKS